MKIVISLLFFLFSNVALALPTAKATILVVDENNIPLEGVDTGIGFSVPKKVGWGSKSAGNRGLTDKNGFYISSGVTERILRYGAKSPGFYSSRYEFTGFTGVSGILGFRKWQPWNPTLKVVLRKIKTPIAMYARKTDWIEIPKIDTFIGFDLVKADWVAPYGKGINADFIFKIEKDMRARGDYDAHLTLKFSNASDGIKPILLSNEVGSRYKLDYLAPASGYKNTLKHHEYSRPNQSLPHIYKNNQNYYFRVRSQSDAEGNITEGLYGKIHGNIEFSRFGYSNGQIRFTYYLNPTSNDRNIEFDPHKNLFKRLGNMNQVTMP